LSAILPESLFLKGLTHDSTRSSRHLMLTLGQQVAVVEEASEIFLPIPGGWGKMGHTHIPLAAASEDVLTGALRTAWKLRIIRTQRQAEKPYGGSAAE
jgi:hypothetical protein